MILKIAEQPEIRQLKQYIHRSLFTAAEKHAGESYYTRLRLEGPPPSPARPQESRRTEVDPEMAELVRKNLEWWNRVKSERARDTDLRQHDGWR